MLKGVPHKALAQVDKHSDEQSLQRISEPVTTACGQIDKMVSTEVPGLRRPWFAESHSDISSPLFLAIWKAGVVHFTDDTAITILLQANTATKKAYLHNQKNVFFNDQGAPEDACCPICTSECSL